MTKIMGVILQHCFEIFFKTGILNGLNMLFFPLLIPSLASPLGLRLGCIIISFISLSVTVLVLHLLLYAPIVDVEEFFSRRRGQCRSIFWVVCGLIHLLLLHVLQRNYYVSHYFAALSILITCVVRLTAKFEDSLEIALSAIIQGAYAVIFLLLDRGIRETVAAGFFANAVVAESLPVMVASFACIPWQGSHVPNRELGYANLEDASPLYAAKCLNRSSFLSKFWFLLVNSVPKNIYKGSVSADD